MSDQKPRCGGCGAELKCQGCDDIRACAEELYAGMRIRTPFGRWESITRVSRAGDYGPVFIYTTETSVIPRQYHRWTKVEAREPERESGGRPEVRVTEYDWRTGAILAAATHDRMGSPSIGDSGILVEAHTREGHSGWVVHHRPTPEGDVVQSHKPSKAAARTEVRRLAREYAKKMGVPMRIEERRR